MRTVSRRSRRYIYVRARRQRAVRRARGNGLPLEPFMDVWGTQCQTPRDVLLTRTDE